MLGRTTPTRILHELELTLAEAEPGPALALLNKLGILQAIHPALRWSHALMNTLNILDGRTVAGLQNLSTRNLSDLKLMLLLYDMDALERIAFADYYGLTSHRKSIIEDINKIQEIRSIFKATDITNSTLDRNLNGLQELALYTAAIAETPPIANHIQHYLAVLRHAKPALTGRDLQVMHIPPGPLYRILLEGLRAAFLDGVVSSVEQQRAWISQHLRGEE